MNSKPIEDRLCPDPPAELAQREVWAALQLPNTLRVPRDPEPDDDRMKWFNWSSDMPRVTSGNEVKFLIDGVETFREMIGAMETVKGPGHFILVIGWFLDVSFPLVPQPSLPGDRSTTGGLFQVAAKRGAQVRALLWKNPLTDQNNAAIDFINGLVDSKGKRAGFAIHDSRLCFVSSSHHQKVVVVYGSEGLIGFCGGIDINPDRVFATNEGSNQGGSAATLGCPMHDVHCRITGAAAEDLLSVFEQRWTDHPESADLLPLSIAHPLRVAAPAGPSRQHVQIGRTFGGAWMGSLPQAGFTLVPQVSEVPGYSVNIIHKPFSFAPNGEQTARRMILHAIENAKRFIYMEDQYMVHLGAAEALREASKRLNHVTILIPADSIASPPFDIQNRRAKFVLQTHDMDKKSNVRVFQLKHPGMAHSYVHAKTWIFDDEYAIIGSANCNNRSWTSDSEAVAGIADQSRPDNWGLGFAHRLRIALWAEHLNMHPCELVDGVASAVHWDNPPGPDAAVNKSSCPVCGRRECVTNVEPFVPLFSDKQPLSPVPWAGEMFKALIWPMVDLEDDNR